MSKQAAWQAVGRALGELAEETREQAAQLRELECARLDQLQSACWDRALEGDLEAIRTVLQIIITRSRLFGLSPLPVVEASYIPPRRPLPERLRAAAEGLPELEAIAGGRSGPKEAE